MTPRQRWHFADLTLDRGQRSLVRSGQRLKLAKLTFDFLAVLVERAPNVVTHTELAQRVWPGRIVTHENMTQRVGLLRLALGDDAKEPKYIRVVHGQGYQLIPTVTVSSARPVVQQAWSTSFALRHARTLVTLAVLVAALVAIGLLELGPLGRRAPGSGLTNAAAGSPASPAAATAGTVFDRWRAALVQAPDNLNNLLGLGRVLCEAGRFDDGLGHLRKAEVLHPDSTIALEHLARCLLMSGNYAATREAIARGVALNARFPLRDVPINTGLEEGLYGWRVTYDQGLQLGPNRNAVFSNDTVVARSGKTSGRFHSTIPRGGAGTISAFAPLDFLGKRIQMSAYLKTERVEQGASLWLRVDSLLPGSIETTFLENTAYRAIRGDTDWTRQEIVADVPPSAAYIYYGYGFTGGTGTIWIDDVAFEAVDAATPLTGTAYSEPNVLAAPSNLDFERGLADWTVHGAPIADGNETGVHATDGFISLAVHDDERWVRQDILAGALPGKRLRLRARVNRQTATGSLRASVGLRTRHYGGIEGTAIARRWIEDGEGWKTYDVVIDVPEIATKVFYSIVASGQGTLLVDDVQLEVVDASVPLTPLSSPMDASN